VQRVEFELRVEKGWGRLMHHVSISFTSLSFAPSVFFAFILFPDHLHSISPSLHLTHLCSI
jgi:hypothetical protein